MSLSKLQSFDLAEHLASLKESICNLSSYLLNLGQRTILPAAKEHQTLVTIALITLVGQAYYWHKFSFWSRRNIKTPRPLPVFGNFLAFIFDYRQRLELEWPKKYGKLYGLYVGTSPRLVIADAAIARRIATKDFASFPNHFFFNSPNKYQRHFLIAQKDDHWRGMRAIMTPTFSSGRIKVMYQLLNDCADEICREHDRRIDSGKSEVNTRQIYGSFSMSSTLKCFYGINLNLNQELQQEMKGNSDETAGGELTAAGFARRSREAFRPEIFRFFLVNLLPPKLLKLLNYHNVDEKRMDFFAQCVRKLVEERQRARVKFNDYLQLLVDARAHDQIQRLDSEKKENHHAPYSDQLESWRPSNMALTDMEILCQGVMLMMVATETTSTLIAHSIYLMAHHPEVQERLHDEVQKIGSRDDRSPFRSFDYDELISCEYLDCVISETLRLMSPVVAMDRVASEDYHIDEYDVTVPRGTVLSMAYYAIHLDPDYWPEPHEFNPERFSAQNKYKIVPGSYVPFGSGPRACIGFRFGLAEAKLGIAKLICSFKFSQAPNTKYPPEPMKPVFVQNDFKDLRVVIARR